MKAGDELELHHRDARLDAATALCGAAFVIADEGPSTYDRIIGDDIETTRAAPVQAWTRHDAIVLAGLAGVAAVAIVLGTLGATRLQPIGGLASSWPSPIACRRRGTPSTTAPWAGGSGCSSCSRWWC